MSSNGVRSSPSFIIAAVAMAMFVDMFVDGAVITVLPELLTKRTRVEPRSLQTTVAGLVATANVSITLCAPIAGYVADSRSSRKAPLLIGSLAMNVAVALFMLSKDLIFFFFARFLSGVSSGIVWSAGLALLIDTVDAERVGYAMGYVRLVVCLGQAAGPLLGGTVYTRGGHYATLAMILVLVVVDTVLRISLREQNREIGLLSNSDQANGALDTHPEPTERQPLIGQEELQKKAPLQAFKLLMNRDILLSLWCVVLVMGVFFGIATIVPLHIETTFDLTSSGAGLVYLSMMIPAFASPLIGSIYDRIGSHLTSIAGFVLVTIFALAMASIRMAGSSSLFLFASCLFLVGLGSNSVMVPEMAAISSFGEKQSRKGPQRCEFYGTTAQSCALFALATSLGGVLGSLVVGSVESAAGWAAASETLAGFAAIGVVSLFIVAFGYRSHQRSQVDVSNDTEN